MYTDDKGVETFILNQVDLNALNALGSLRDEKNMKVKSDEESL